VFLVEGVVVVLTVMIAAVMEAAGIVNPVVGLALWLPTALAIAVFAVYVRGGHL
jgi:hypothetical protein